jgi:hypothetical protein
MGAERRIRVGAIGLEISFAEDDEEFITVFTACAGEREK